MSIKDPSGGLTSEGRRYFARKEGAHLKPGVKGPANTPEKLRRKGSFLRRHFATLRGPLVDDQGKPTRLALSAHAWGEPVPRTLTAARKLAAKGARLLERYAASKAGKKAPAKNSLVGNINRRKKAGKSRSKASSTISKKAYTDMQRGWPRKKRASKKA
jgi:hypothetical protein